VANRKEHNDSFMRTDKGDRFNTIRVFEFPLSEYSKRVRQLPRLVISGPVYLEIENKSYLGVSAWNMLIVPVIQRGDNISESTQALVDIPYLFQPILGTPSPASLE